MSRKLLIVDDELALRSMLVEAFSDMGFEVHDAECGSEALTILETENIQVMFLDLNMPEMTGIELCKKIRADHPIACIYAMTGYVSLFELSECREAGFDDYFTKPVKLELLFKTAEEAFEKIERWKNRQAD